MPTASELELTGRMPKNSSQAGQGLPRGEQSSEAASSSLGWTTSVGILETWLQDFGAVPSTAEL